MFADPKVFWLTVTNIALGLIVLLLVLGVVLGVLCEFVGRVRTRRTALRDIDRDMREMFHPGPRHGTR